jgi:hypothetical protein
MTRQSAITQVCDLVSVAYNSIGDYNKSCDCFCEESPGNFSNDGETIAYVRKAVFEKLRRDGFDVKE